MRKLLWALLIAFSMVALVSCGVATEESGDVMENTGEMGDAGDWKDSENADDEIKPDSGVVELPIVPIDPIEPGTEVVGNTGIDIDIREIFSFSPKLVELIDKISRVLWEAEKWVTDLFNGNIPPEYHDHKFGDRTAYSVNEKLFCEDKLFYYACQECDYIEWERGSEADHDFSTESKYDCVKGGYDVITCKRCPKSTVTNEVPPSNGAVDHSYIDHSAKAPTCSENGWYEYQTCENCDYSSYEVAPALGHAYVEHEAKMPTCYEGGYAAYQTCERCDFTSFAEMPPLSHAFVNHKAKEPTCSEVGWAEYQTCKNCDYSTYIELDVVDHKATADLKCSMCGQKTLYYRDGNYIYFGEYPQTIKSSSVSVGTSTDSRGYYLGSDGNYYAKVVADPYSSGYKFSDNSTVYYSTTYYFKVEPIRWRILIEDNSNNALILCDSIIEKMAYDSNNKNNYRDSDVRAWLNETFYATAFSKLQKDIILTTTVDNSAYSTGNSSNSYACENTEDKIFLPSYREVTNTGYDFDSSYSTYDYMRRLSASDYTRALGIYISTGTSYYGSAYWWLRSPYYSYSYNTRYVNYNGGISYASANYQQYGVVPALWINLDNILAVECTHSETETVYENVTDATCRGDGSQDEVVYCTTCGDELSRTGVVIPAVAHKYSNGYCEYCGGKFVYSRCDEYGNPDADGDYILFGEYPQTVKSSSVTITPTKDERGYYLGSDGSYYARVTADPYTGSYKFSNDATINEREVYYFKVEPIRWRILGEGGGCALVLCDMVIEKQVYDESYNKYNVSDVRRWLNETFYEVAFSDIQKELILTEKVDNSAYSTGYDSNPYAGEDTYDKLFLPSYSEVTNAEFGFSSSYLFNDPARKIKTTDYVRALGAVMTLDSLDYGSGYWWLRSPADNGSKYARYVLNTGSVSGYSYTDDEAIGVVPALFIQLDYYHRDGDYIYFGEYPQRIKADDVTITETQDERGYYLGSDGSYYAKVVADPYTSGYKFSNGATVTDGATYYFKVEPICWRILTEESGNALILCESIIANMAYDGGYDNNYKDSDVRAWLNATFYETAFSELQRELILTTTVDNSVFSTGYSSNPYACEDTQDKLFLLSGVEVISTKYGLSSFSNRRMETTDYTRATGAYMNTSADYYGNGSWWLRSPNAGNSYSAGFVSSGGDANSSSNGVGDQDYGVVPALWIKI